MKMRSSSDENDSEMEKQPSVNIGELINCEDLSVIKKEQKQMLEKLEKMNLMLSNCNNISEQQYKILGAQFQQHTTVLVDMKKNLSFLHTHIRQLKATINEKYPDSNKAIAHEQKSNTNVTTAIGLEGEDNN